MLPAEENDDTHYDGVDNDDEVNIMVKMMMIKMKVKMLMMKKK